MSDTGQETEITTSSISESDKSNEFSAAEKFTVAVYAAILEKENISHGELFYDNDSVTVAKYKKAGAGEADLTTFNSLTFFKQDKPGERGKPVAMDIILRRGDNHHVVIHYDHAKNNITYMVDSQEHRLLEEIVKEDEFPRILQAIKEF